MTFIGALFTAVVCWALGRLLFRRLRISLNGIEDDLLAGVAGAALLSLAVFVLCSIKLARTPVFAAAGIAALATLRRDRGDGQAKPPVLPVWFIAIFALYAVLYLSNSLAPEFSPDGATYHLGLVARYFRQHGFVRLTTNMYGNLSQGMEMLFLFAFAFGRHSAAATLHCLFLLTLPFLILAYGRRAGHPRAGVCAALLVFLSPVAGIDGVSAYNDVALATAGFALFYLIEIWRDNHDGRLFVPIGLLAGFCFAIKYTGFVALIYAAFALRRRFLRILPAAACMIAPWLIKNSLWIGNPASPFFNRIFRNPYIHITLEDFYRHYFARYGLVSLKPLFWIATVTGQLGGQIGPVFLLAPVALLSLRFKAGQHCLVAALIFMLAYPQNIGARFLIPVLPFVALAMAMAIEIPAVLVAIAAAAAIFAWPRVIDRYRAPSGGWQIATMPWQAALHIVPQDKWLAGRQPGYRLATAINRIVPAGQRLWSSVALPEAYIDRDALVYYYSAESEEMQDILLMPLNEATQPLWKFRFTFPARKLSRLRIVQDSDSPDDVWSIGEVRFFNGLGEVNPARASAEPFPWNAGLALDRNPVTRWRTWEPIHPGMHFDADFGTPVTVGRVEVYCSRDQSKIRMHLDGIDAQLETFDDSPAGDLRAIASRTVKSRGISYLVIGDAFDAARDMRADPARWGLRIAAQQDQVTLYQIQ